MSESVSNSSSSEHVSTAVRRRTPEGASANDVFAYYIRYKLVRHMLRPEHDACGSPYTAVSAGEAL